MKKPFLLALLRVLFWAFCPIPCSPIQISHISSKYDSGNQTDFYEMFIDPEVYKEELIRNKYKKYAWGVVFPPVLPLCYLATLQARKKAESLNDSILKNRLLDDPVDNSVWDNIRYQRNDHLLSAVDTRNLDALDLLLHKNGYLARLNLERNGTTPFLYAAQHEWKEGVEAMLRRGERIKLIGGTNNSSYKTTKGLAQDGLAVQLKEGRTVLERLIMDGRKKPLELVLCIPPDNRSIELQHLSPPPEIAKAKIPSKAVDLALSLGNEQVRLALLESPATFADGDRARLEAQAEIAETDRARLEAEEFPL